MGGWDDGAITAAFARTWMSTGHIALTPSSITVEGFSTVLWFFLLSLAPTVTHSPSFVLVWMKLCSAICALACLPLLYSVSKRLFGTITAPAVALVVFAFSSTTFYEIQNGMEMLLAAFLLLMLFECLTRPRLKFRSLYAGFIGSLLLLTRFEAPFEIALLLGGMLLAAWNRGSIQNPAEEGETSGVPFPSRRDLVATALILLAVFVATELIRHRWFHAWMPNTIYAKMWHPYTAWTGLRESVVMRVEASIDALVPVSIFLWSVAAATLIARPHVGRSAYRWWRPHPAIVTMAFGSLVLGALLGPAFGYTGRMTAPMLPFLILYGTYFAMEAIRAQSATRRLLFPVAILLVLSWARTVHRPDPVISVADARAVGDAANDVRIALHREHVVVLMPDIGGSSLFYPNITVVDSALLANPVLAKQGWTHFGQYTRDLNPDIIETHAVWAEEQNAYHDGSLDNYSIVAARGIRLFVRDDLYKQLLPQFPGSVFPVVAIPGCLPPHPEDADFSFTKGTCLVMNDPDVQRNYM